MRYLVSSGLLALAAFASCKADNTDTATPAAATAAGATSTTTPAQQAGTLAINALADTYPEGFAISALPAKIPVNLPTSIQSAGTIAAQTALALDVAEPMPPAAYDPSSATVSEKLSDATAKLKGEGDCFEPGLLNTRTFDIHSIRCYDPDGDLDTPVNGSTPGAKLDGSDEACLAGYGRATMASTIGVVDSATGLVLAMLCQAKKDGKASALPEVAATLDLKSSLETALPGLATVSAATITRLPDQPNGHPLYRTDIAIAARTQRSIEVHLLHSPSPSDGNTEANGRLWVKKSGEGDGAQLVQVTYARSGTSTEPRLQYRFVEGLFKTTGSGPTAPLALGADPFDANGKLDLNKDEKADHSFAGDTPQDHNKVLSSQQFIAFDINPLTNAGKLMFWKNFGGFYDEAARGMVFDLERGDGNGVAGCSISGATGGANGAFSVRKAQKEGFDKLIPRGYYHPHGTPQFAAMVYKQCFRQDATGKYLIDDAATQDDAKGFDILPAASVDVSLPDLASLPELSL